MNEKRETGGSGSNPGSAVQAYPLRATQAAAHSSKARGLHRHLQYGLHFSCYYSCSSFLLFFCFETVNVRLVGAPQTLEPPPIWMRAHTNPKPETRTLSQMAKHVLTLNHIDSTNYTSPICTIINTPSTNSLSCDIKF